ncbi:glycosyltransferase family 32 protein [Roseateles puraquae]|uniref:Mannosyltransferase n=1 Tax=Roseateles puraquae TaxID=431059 RepID=A0A254NFY7_9BURK|nr:capsular polysaccharide synthesis protein [Roseateles puraquae]MDG0852816.1 mannosyltransferase [Roseateles puraquae]OWR05177.1 mannosyltransferase [Roseateles puraquae]
MNLVIHAVQALLVLLTGLLVWETLTVLRARVPAQTRAVTVGDEAPASTATLPRIIWTYWQTAPAPEFIQACIANWRQFAPNHEVRLLDRSSIESWLPSLRADFNSLPAYRQADWLRVQLLARHGGIWMDASMLLSRDLGWLHDTQRRRGADYVGFYIDRYSTRPTLPIIENWMMASVPGGRFVSALAAAFDLALDEGAEALLQRLRSEGRHAQVVQALTEDFQRYLLMHVAASELLDRSPQLARLVLLRAEDGPFAWHAGVGWRKRHLFARLALAPCPRMLPAVLKLRGGDRTVVERNWRRGWVSPFSALRHLLAPPR